MGTDQILVHSLGSTSCVFNPRYGDLEASMKPIHPTSSIKCDSGGQRSWIVEDPQVFFQLHWDQNSEPGSFRSSWG